MPGTRDTTTGPAVIRRMRLLAMTLLAVLALVAMPALAADTSPAIGTALPAAADPAPETAPEPPPETAPAIALATVAPGDIYWQRFGHNALTVTPADGRPALSFNFGYFDFNQPGFLARFLRGRMLYQALALDAAGDLGGYVDEQRAVDLQHLALAPAQAQRLADLLATAVQPEHRDYRYDYFRHNCSTRLRDALDQALDGELHAQTASRSRGFTYRMHARRLAQGNFWLATGIDLGLGPDTDRRLSFWEEMFIPEMLRRYLREVDTAQGPLVAAEDAWYPGTAEPPPEIARDLRPAYGITGVVLAIGLLWLARRQRGTVAGPDALRQRLPLPRRRRRLLAAIATGLHLLFGLAGLILLLLWLGTDHVAAHRNENLFLLSPLSLLLMLAWLPRLRGNAAPATGSWSRLGTALAVLVAASAVLGLASKPLPGFIQQNMHWCLLLVPVHLALLRLWWLTGPVSAAARPASDTQAGAGQSG